MKPPLLAAASGRLAMRSTLPPPDTSLRSLSSDVAGFAWLLPFALLVLDACAQSRASKDLETEQPDAQAGRPNRTCTSATTTLAPDDGVIATTAGDTFSFKGKLVAYPEGKPNAPAATTTGGVLHIVENVQATEGAQYVGLALVFSTCVDARAFTGVRFAMRGTWSGCRMQYATGDVEHQDPASSAIYAEGEAGSYPAQIDIDPSPAGEPRTVDIPFGHFTIPGNPSKPIDVGKLILVLWQFSVDGASVEENCQADITIDRVSFY